MLLLLPAAAACCGSSNDATPASWSAWHMTYLQTYQKNNW
jgi:hypothetical protein